MMLSRHAQMGVSITDQHSKECSKESAVICFHESLSQIQSQLTSVQRLVHHWYKANSQANSIK